MSFLRRAKQLFLAFKEASEEVSSELEGGIDQFALGFGGCHLLNGAENGLVFFSLLLALRCRCLALGGFALAFGFFLLAFLFLALALFLFLLCGKGFGLFLLLFGLFLLLLQLRHFVCQDFVGRLAVFHLVVLAVEVGGLLYGLLAFGGGQSASLSLWGQDDGALYHTGDAFLVEERNQGFANAEFGNDGFGVEGRIGTEGIGGHVYGFLVAWGVGSQGVLYAVAHLSENGVGDVDGVLGAEIDSYAFGADETDNLFDAFLQRLVGVVEQQVGFVEEEYQLGFVEVADFGQLLVEFAEEVEQEGGVDFGGVDDLVGSEDVDDALAVLGLQEIEDVDGGFAEEVVAALVLQGEQSTLYGTDGGGGDIAVGSSVLRTVVANLFKHFAEVFEVEQ